MKTLAILVLALTTCLTNDPTPGSHLMATKTSETVPLHDPFEEVRYVLLQWTKAMYEEDGEAMATILHKDFPGREGYLAGLVGNKPKKVSLKNARFEKVGDSVKVSEIAVYLGLLEFVWSSNILFKMEGQSWKILSIETIPVPPKEYLQSSHLDQEVLLPIKVSLKDAKTGEQMSARVSTNNKAGKYYPPQGHMNNIPTGWREDMGGSVIVNNKTYAYVEPEFTLMLPIGKYEMEVSCGMEYEPRTLQFEVRADELPQLEVRLRRWSHMQAKGWYSGDTHVHFLDPQSALLEMRGEDLPVVNILATKWADLITNAEHFTGGLSPVSTPQHLVYVNEECRHNFLGHTILLNLKELVYPLSWGSPPEGVPAGWDYPAMAHQIDKTHQQGGFVSWAHFPNPSGELAIDIALGKVDAVDLFTFDNSLSEGPIFPDTIPAAPTWYRFLNCGFRLPALGGTDKMANNQVVGSVRTYVKVDGEFTYENWIAGIKAGRTFVTTGPMLTFTVNGKEIGETILGKKGEKLSVRAEVNSLFPVEKIEIVQGGKIVAIKENPQRLQNMVLEVDLTATESSWIAARAYSSEWLPYQKVAYLQGIPLMAHTSPIYLTVDNRPTSSPKDAAYFIKMCDRAINWAKTKGKYESQEQLTEIITLFEEAKANYLRQMGE